MSPKHSFRLRRHSRRCVDSCRILRTLGLSAISQLEEGKDKISKKTMVPVCKQPFLDALVVALAPHLSPWETKFRKLETDSRLRYNTSFFWPFFSSVPSFLKVEEVNPFFALYHSILPCCFSPFFVSCLFCLSISPPSALLPCCPHIYSRLDGCLICNLYPSIPGPVPLPAVLFERPSAYKCHAIDFIWRRFRMPPQPVLSLICKKLSWLRVPCFPAGVSP
ncbi:hypothetical protein BDR22DRAFT_867703 [Usnea florida]